MNNLTFISRHDYYFTPGRERYFAGRWPFASMVIEKIKTLEGVERVLELGPGPGSQPLVNGADTMGRPMEKGRFCKSDDKCKILHDARVTPWPVESKAYDLFMALQVFEHLEGSQAEAFAEVRRVSRQAILTLPFMCQMKSHHIGWEEYGSWFGETWQSATLVDSGRCRKYMLHFIFEP